MPDHDTTHSATAAQHPTSPDGGNQRRTLGEIEHFLDSNTYYAIVNPEARGFTHPFIITNEQHGPSQMSVGSEPAIFEIKEAAAEQLALQEEAFGSSHLHVVKFRVEAVLR